MNPLSNILGAARGLALAVTLAGTLGSSPRREIRQDPGTPRRTGHRLTSASTAVPA